MLGIMLLVAAAIILAGTSVLRPDRKDLDALAGAADALLERLPRPDAALLIGLALRDPPKWNVSLTSPKLARIAEPEPRASEPVRTVSVDAIPPPAPLDRDTLLPEKPLAPIADLSVAAPPTRPAEALPAVSSQARVPAATIATARARHLVVVHMISPRYPDSRAVKEPVRVDVRFGLNADGTVRDVAAVTGSDDARGFGESAEKAMRQWRFDPATVPADPAARFQQSFVFARQSDVRHRARPGDGEEYDCVKRTGSLVCRHPQEEEVALPLTIIQTNLDSLE
jgi:TonB family protein